MISVLYLGIPSDSGPEVYEVSPLDPHPDVALQAWRLRKVEGGAVYDLRLTDGYWLCDCEDFIARKADVGLLCKHLTAMADRGLLGRRA